jgi:cytochrome bd-type quinol oxidase subunit 1
MTSISSEYSAASNGGLLPSDGNGSSGTEQKQETIEAMLGKLPSETRRDMAATVVQGLDTVEQKQAAAQAVLGTLPSETRQDMAATVVQGLDTVEQKQAAAQAVVGTLPAEAQQQLAETVLGSPDQRTRQVLWYMVVSTLTLAVFAFGSMAFVLVYQGKAAEAPLALATAALGGIIGLVATSPGSRS